MRPYTQITSTPTRPTQPLEHLTLMYPSPASTPGSSTSAEFNTPARNDWADSPLTLSSPSDDAAFSNELDISPRPEDFLPPPWDPIAHEQSMPKLVNGHIPRPPNSFMLFRSHVLKNIIAERMDDHQQKVSCIAGGIWKNPAFPEYIKEAWCERAKVVQHWHASRFPAYKFTPRKTSPKSVKGDDSDDGEDKCQKYLKRYFNTASPIPQSSHKRKQPRSLRRVGDSDNEDDDDYVPTSRSRSSRRTARRSKKPLLPSSTPPPTSESARTGCDSQSHRATPSLYPSPPVTPAVSPTQRLSELMRAHSNIGAQIAQMRAELSTTYASPVPPPHSTLVPSEPKFSLVNHPPMPNLADLRPAHDAFGSTGSSSSSYQAFSRSMQAHPSRSMHATHSGFANNSLGLNGTDVFGPVIPNISSARPRHHTPSLPRAENPMQLLGSIYSFPLLEASANPSANTSSGTEPMPEDDMASFFDFSQFAAAPSGTFEGSS